MKSETWTAGAQTVATPVSKKIGIVGARSRNTSYDLIIVFETFIEVYNEGDVIVSGGAPKGGDRFAKLIADKKGIPIIEYLPDTKKYKSFVASAFARNTLIANDSDILIACVSEPRSNGTQDTIRKFLKKNALKTENEAIEKGILIIV